MIETLTGILKDKNATHVVVETGGIGFSLPISLSTFDALPLPGQPVTVYTHLAVKEDDMTLFGFATPEERSLFRKLIQVSGIGPKIAMTALSGLSARDLRTAIITADTKRLSSISGIGKKMAERLVVELKDKFDKSEQLEAGSRETPVKGNRRDAVLALVALGYKQQDARRLLDKAVPADQGDLPVEEMVRRALGGA
jgi:Holliday junction DNA helicase RuvA